jgi:hypothetical protein
MKRFSSVLLMFLFACGQPKGGAQTENVPSLRVYGTEPVSLAVGSMGGCTIIGTNLRGKAQGLYVGLTSAHCFPQQKLLCQDKTITWSDRKSTSKCVNVVGGAGEGGGDFVLLELDSVPANATEKRVASEISQGDRLEVIGSDGATKSGCAVTSIVGNVVEHSCLQQGSSGYSGSPIFSIKDGVKSLVGIHVSQSPGSKQATPWPTNFIRNYQIGKIPSALKTQTETYEFNLCRSAFNAYLAAKSISALQPNTFTQFLASGYISWIYADTCKIHAAGVPLGAGLLRKGDAGCKKGKAEEDCGSVCCDPASPGLFKPQAKWETVCGDWKLNREEASPPMPVCRQQ